MKFRAEATKDVEDGTVPKRYRFADVLLQKNRCDLVQPFGPDVVMRALDQIINHSAIRPTIEALLGPEAVLYEFSCLISDPGSQRQVIHPDTPYGAMGGLAADEPVLFTCFVSLQDILDDMGPTIWLPRTHTQKAHEEFKDESTTADEKDSPKDRLLRTTPAVLGTLPQGCCGIFDSRLLHAGGANMSGDNMSRALFYVSFKNPKIGYPGNPASARPETVDAKFTITRLGEELEAYSKGKPSRDMEALIAGMR
jgi:ectoine hydroxylase-related dioxygenase (phytanoyl-CoA dioxygenase family)